MEIADALREYFGFEHFRPGQEEAISQILAGRDVFVVMPTGAGKSLIYQLAALLLPGTTLVVSPLIALMKDQVDVLRRRGLAATFINSSQEPVERAEQLSVLAAGGYRIVYVAPERFRSRQFRAALAGVTVSLLAIDEAHCVSEWGHDFRPDYLQLAEARRDLGYPPTVALTATATQRVQSDVPRLLEMATAHSLVLGFDRTNLHFEVIWASDTAAKLRSLQTQLEGAAGAAIVYVATRHDAEYVADFIRQEMGLNAAPYHALLEANQRSRTQDDFLAGRLQVVVATSAFGMGIDRSDVRLVLHFTLPGSLAAYYQAAGRAGRDGLPARAVLLFTPSDSSLHRYFIENDFPLPGAVAQLHASLPPLGRIRWGDLERITGLTQTKVRLVLHQLQFGGVVLQDLDERDGWFKIETGVLSDDALESIAGRVAARREHRHTELDGMVRYAALRQCRRRALLDHFGDATVNQVEHCCDGCSAEVAEGSSEIEQALPRPGDTRHRFATRKVGDVASRGPGADVAAAGAESRMSLRAIGRSILNWLLGRTSGMNQSAEITQSLVTLCAGIDVASSPTVRRGNAGPSAHRPLDIVDGTWPGADPVDTFLARSHARPLTGPWSFGWALDFHSRFEGDRNRRGQVGDLVFRYKYGGERGLANELTTHWHQLLNECGERLASTAVVPVPSSVERELDLVWLLANSLAERLGLPAWHDALVKARATCPQKDMTSLAQKRANVAGAFAVQRDVRGQRLMVVDDVHDSGETLAEATRVLLRAGAADVMVLTLTTTIHTGR